MHDKLRQLRRYPVMLLFFAFIALYSLVDFIMPEREFSELENRRLAAMPAFEPSAFFSNRWTREVGDAIEDQFLLRDGWISLQSHLEYAQGKLAVNGVWLAEGGFQIAANSSFTEAQQNLLALNSEAVGSLAAAHPGKVRVMVVPSPANSLAGKLRYSPPQANENALLDEAFATMRAAGAEVIDLRGVLGEEHYYHTDHHWNLTGVQAAYEAYCAAAGQSAVAPAVPLVGVEGFRGTNYAKTKLDIPRGGDLLQYRVFPYPLTVHKLDSAGGVTLEEGPLMDEAKLDAYDKYGAFLRGNNGYSVLQGEGEGKLLLVKDSYGNSFAPFLGQNYAEVGIIDLRSWHEVNETFASGGYDEILVLYSFDNFTTDSNVVRMMK